MIDEIATIHIAVQGEETKTQYRGAFKVRTLLSRRQIAAADAIRRAILGPDSESAFTTIKEDAFMAGFLAISITDAPDWFRVFGEGGIDCPDRQLLKEVHAKWQEACQERRNKLEETSSAAREELAKKV